MPLQSYRLAYKLKWDCELKYKSKEDFSRHVDATKLEKSTATRVAGCVSFVLFVTLKYIYVYRGLLIQISSSNTDFNYLNRLVPLGIRDIFSLLLNSVRNIHAKFKVAMSNSFGWAFSVIEKITKAV